MTQQLKHAIDQASKLSNDEQDALAAIILEEMKVEQAWESSFARSQDSLAKLAEMAREDIRTGRVSEHGIDEL